MNLTDAPWSGTLLDVIGRLARSATQEFTPEDVLQQLCDAAAEALAVDGTGVMGLNLGRTRFVRASRLDLEPVERLQEALQAGPCRDAIDSGTPVTAETQAEIADRWPDFAAVATELDLHAVLALPLRSRGRTWGSLDLYWNTAHAPTPLELDAAALLADVAVSYLVMATERVHYRSAQEQLANRILHDQLTGLPNRGLIHELIFHALATAQRQGTSVAVLFVDLDLFKAVNDEHGHLIGDLVLQELSRRLRGAIRSEDTVGRLSGDEFIVVCEALPASAEIVGAVVSRLAERIAVVVAQPVRIGSVTIDITASIGAAVTSGRPSAADLIHDADTAMYEAKAAGGGAFVIHDAVGEAAEHSRRGLERRLFEAVERAEFLVFYQPILDRDGRLTAVEALLRWDHPSEGLIPAAEFIAVAESTGAVVPIGHWVIREALAQLTRWRAEFPSAAPTLVFCNLSPRELIAPDLTDVIGEALTRHGLTPGHLGLEILENDLAAPRLNSAVRQLHTAGHPLAIDDFGTGYSSLARLVELPVTHLKIDRSLVNGLPADPRSQTLIRAVMTIATNLDIQVISEGIENADQVTYLKGAGSAFFQGYHLGRPMPADEITALLAHTVTTAASQTVTSETA